MRSLIAPTFTEPSGYELSTRDDPTISKPTDILLKIHAASINAHDVIMASGRTKMLQVLPLPYPIGLDFAGTILDVGSAVKGFAPGESVYGFSFAGGAASTHLLLDTTQPHALCKIPQDLEMADAASLPCVAVTAQLGLKRADDFLPGGLAGKTVFIPAALSGVGNMALQIAKRLYGCRTVTAVSTAKLPQISRCLGEGVVDEAIDYTQSDIIKEIGKASVEFVFDTTGLASDYLPLLKKGGLLLSIARLPPGSALKNEDPNAPKQSRVACIGQNVMDAQDAAFRTWAKTRYGVSYEYMKTDPRTEDLEAVGELVRDGKLKAVVGKTAKLESIEEVRDACAGILKGKGGVGKFVTTMDDNTERQ
jgi:NADPH:quinone reductase-like Zn-dependent oxidoreductase